MSYDKPWSKSARKAVRKTEAEERQAFYDKKLADRTQMFRKQGMPAEEAEKTAARALSDESKRRYEARK